MSRSRRLELAITAKQDGARVDRLLRKELHLSVSAVRRAKRIPSGITLNGAVVYSNETVQEGQTLSVQVGDTALKQHLIPMQGEISRVYEDEDLIVLDKTAPLAVHPSPTYHGDTLANYLLFYYEEIGLTASFHPVSRLDRGTSGLMVVAKHAHAHERLAALLHGPDFCREYLAVCEGLPEPRQGCIDAAIGRVPDEVLRRAVRADGAPARTRYRTLQSDGARSLLHLRLETGRTHQIRVHMASLGCPLVGDFLYGEEVKALPDRFALHSAYLSLRQPISGQQLTFSSPLPEALAALLKAEALCTYDYTGGPL